MNRQGRFARFVANAYFPLVITMWCVMPGIRRIVDWQIGFHSIALISILPLMSLVPLILPVYRSLSSDRLSPAFKAVCFVWFFGFIYALVVALASGGLLNAIYQFAVFCLPLICGAWVVTRDRPRAESFNQLTTTFLWLGGILSAYGLYQYVSPPPWDVLWVNNVNLVSIGTTAEPFGLHVFSTLNAPGTASIFFAFVILIGLHKLDLRRPWPLIVVIMNVAALALTNARSSWLALVVGMLVYFVMSPKRVQPFFALAAIAMVCLAAGGNAAALVGNAAITQQLQARLATLNDIDNDASVSDRRGETSIAAHEALAEPLGQGLGTVGTSTKLEENGKEGQLVLDNGYISRFLEMGVAGFIAYLLTLTFAAFFVIRVFLRSIAEKNPVLQQIAATSLSIQVALLGLDLSSDEHSAFGGLIFWVFVGLALRLEAGDEPVKSWLRPTPNLPQPDRPILV